MLRELQVQNVFQLSVVSKLCRGGGQGNCTYNLHMDLGPMRILELLIIRRNRINMSDVSTESNLFCDFWVLWKVFPCFHKVSRGRPLLVIIDYTVRGVVHERPVFRVFIISDSPRVMCERSWGTCTGAGNPTLW